MNYELQINVVSNCFWLTRKIGSVIRLLTSLRSWSFSYSVILLSVLVSNLWAQSDYLIEPLSLNNNYTNEIFAIPYEKGIICSSDRRTHVLVSRLDISNQQLFHLFYVSQKDSNKWSFPHLLSKNISINIHQGSCSVSADGKEIYFSVNDETGQRIFSASKSHDDWTNIRPFAHNRPNYTTTHPSLSSDGKRLFFASNIPDGFGGFDIYVCERTSSGWGAPKNLGPEVNTPENELYPFIQGNGELYFSSSAHDSMGGLDIFSVRENNGVWGLRYRLDEPINSTADDISYTAADADGTHGYIASNRAGKSFDLFSFKSFFPVFNNCEEQEENNYTYEFREKMAMGLDTTTLRLMWDMGDGTTRYGEEVEHTFPSIGQYDVYINVVDTLTGEIEKHVAHEVVHVLDIEQPYITVGETVNAGTPVSFDASNSYLPDLYIEEYYWMFGDRKRKKGIRTEHIYTAPGVYRVQLGVIGRSKWTGEIEKVCVYREIIVQ